MNIVNEREQQIQAPVRHRKKYDIRGFINSPWLLLVGLMIVGGVYLIAHPKYVTLAMNYPFSIAFILAIPVAWFLVKLVINFFSVIEKWIRLQFEKARSSKKGHFFELVTGIFMFVSVCEAGPFFNDIQHNVLGGALGYITVLAFDLIAVVCIDSRRKELAKGGTKAGVYLLGVIICAAVSMIANLYSALLNFQAPTVQNFPELLKSIAPYVGIMFPIMIVFLAFSRDAEIEVDDAETYRKQQQKRVDFLAVRRDIMEKVTAEMQRIDLLQQREFVLKSWLFTKKKVQVVIEVCTEQVLAKVQSELVELKNAFVAETLKETKSSHKLQIEKLESQVAELKTQNQRLLNLQSETAAQVQLKLQEYRQEIEMSLSPLVAGHIHQLEIELAGSLGNKIEVLQVEVQKVKIEQKLFQSSILQTAINQPPMSKEGPSTSSSSHQTIELELKRSGRFNKTQFVMDCLKENAEMSSLEIKERAEKLQQSVSDQIISMARSDFKKLKVEVFDGLPETGELEKVEIGR